MYIVSGSESCRYLIHTHKLTEGKEDESYPGLVMSREGKAKYTQHHVHNSSFKETKHSYTNMIIQYYARSMAATETNLTTSRYFTLTRKFLGL